MSLQGRNALGDQSVAGMLSGCAGLLVAGAGAVALLAGLGMAIGLFYALWGALESPEGAGPYVRRWAEVLFSGLPEPAPPFDDPRLNRVAAAVLLGGGVLLMAFLSLAIMTRGAKILLSVAAARKSSGSSSS